MAVRTPLKLDGSNNLIEMSATDIENIKLEMIRQYGINPSVTLTVVASGGTFAALSDTRWQAGAALSGTDAYPTEATTAEPSLVTVNYDRITYAASGGNITDSTFTSFPVYQTGGNIRAMTATDMRDTFVDDVITRLTTDTFTTEQAGTYWISTATTLTGATRVSSTPIFNDTIANLAAYTQPPETIDQPTTVNSYYLYQIDQAAAGTLPTPLYINANNDLQQYSAAEHRALLLDVVQWYAANVVGYKVVYAQGTSATGARGSAIVNTNIAGATNAGVYDTFNDTAAGLYYAQEYPTGTATTISTNYITCARG